MRQADEALRHLEHSAGPVHRERWRLGLISAASTAGASARCSGHGLLEMATVLALVTLITTQAVPALHHQWQRWRLEAASAEVSDILRRAREQSALKGRMLRLELDRSAAGSTCLVLHDGAAGACRGCEGPPICQPGAAMMARTPPVPAGLTLQSSAASLLWHPAAGTVTPTATVRLKWAQAGVEVQHVVNILGRVRSCAQGERLRDHEVC